MRPISPKIKARLEEDSRMKRCALADQQFEFDSCSGRVQWHHVWVYAGRQIDETWAIVGACSRHHDDVESVPAVKHAFEMASLALAKMSDLMKYPKKDWSNILRFFALKYHRANILLDEDTLSTP